MPHIHEKMDFTCEVFIVHKHKVLLRKHDKYKIWLSVGGHIELDEDPNQAAVREVKEEVGLVVTLWDSQHQAHKFSDGTIGLIPPVFLNRNRINDSHEHVTFVYFAAADNTNARQGETEISDELHWFTKEEIDSPHYNIRENIKLYAHAALDALGTMGQH
jgi:8-oxo-dGTP pyrophosphatase MutT (NUDIX family)